MLKQLLATATLLFAGVAAHASTIDFETGGPYYFSATTALSGQYGSTGVSFAGLGGLLGNGGSILDQGSSFGINAHSGVDFLAFNTAVGTGTTELISFATAQSAVSIYAGSGSAGVYTINAYNGMLLVGTQLVTLTSGNYGLLSVNAPQITSVTVSGTPTYFVLDDLSYSASSTSVTPEPSSLVLLGTGVLGAAGSLRRRLA